VVKGNSTRIGEYEETLGINIDQLRDKQMEYQETIRTLEDTITKQTG